MMPTFIPNGESLICRIYMLQNISNKVRYFNVTKTAIHLMYELLI